MKPCPLNGTKTRPLSKLAVETLENLKENPIRASDLNPGLVNRLLRTSQVGLECLQLPVGKDRKIKNVVHLVHTQWKPKQ